MGLHSGLGELTKINGKRVKNAPVTSVYTWLCALNIHANATTHTIEAKMEATRRMRIAGWLSWEMCREIFIVYFEPVCLFYSFSEHLHLLNLLRIQGSNITTIMPAKRGQGRYEDKRWLGDDQLAVFEPSNLNVSSAVVLGLNKKHGHCILSGGC